MQMHVLTCLAAILATMALGSPALSADAAASTFTKLFIDACVPNMGRPDKVRVWATAHGMAEVTDPSALSLFVGNGEGAAWMAPSASGRFTVSIRGETQGCSVWARAADPIEVRADFVQLMEGVKRPGISVTETVDSRKPTRFGDYDVLSYDVTTPSENRVFVFMLQTAERPGGAFQAWAEVALAQKPR